jgi:hypothetical protein
LQKDLIFNSAKIPKIRNFGFPDKNDDSSLALATTLLDDVDCQLLGDGEMAVFLN